MTHVVGEAGAAQRLDKLLEERGVVDDGTDAIDGHLPDNGDLGKLFSCSAGGWFQDVGQEKPGDVKTRDARGLAVVAVVFRGLHLFANAPGTRVTNGGSLQSLGLSLSSAGRSGDGQRPRNNGIRPVLGRTGGGRRSGQRHGGWKDP